LKPCAVYPSNHHRSTNYYSTSPSFNSLCVVEATRRTRSACRSHPATGWHARGVLISRYDGVLDESTDDAAKTCTRPPSPRV
jgi:hypothetical protein